MEINNDNNAIIHLQTLSIVLIISRMSFIRKEKSSAQDFTKGHTYLAVLSPPNRDDFHLALSLTPHRDNHFVDCASVWVCLVISLDRRAPEVVLCLFQGHTIRRHNFSSPLYCIQGSRVLPVYSFYFVLCN